MLDVLLPKMLDVLLPHIASILVSLIDHRKSSQKLEQNVRNEQN